MNVNKGKWGTNLIGFDALTSYASPSYYVQKMFSVKQGDKIVPTEFSGGNRLYESATRNSKQKVTYLKLVNASGKEQTVHVSVDEPNKIAPFTTTISNVGNTFDYAAPAYSVTVLEFKER